MTARPDTVRQITVTSWRKTAICAGLRNFGAGRELGAGARDQKNRATAKAADRLLRMEGEEMLDATCRVCECVKSLKAERVKDMSCSCFWKLIFFGCLLRRSVFYTPPNMSSSIKMNSDDFLSSTWLFTS